MHISNKYLPHSCIMRIKPYVTQKAWDFKHLWNYESDELFVLWMQAPNPMVLPKEVIINDSKIFNVYCFWYSRIGVLPEHKGKYCVLYIRQMLQQTDAIYVFKTQSPRSKWQLKTGHLLWKKTMTNPWLERKREIF